ncbi:MAG: hypothetical protein IKB53_02100 [Oscillospiraceae bacterium]|nr:hypothetical protein [Oscillospiraceae bacterium]
MLRTTTTGVLKGYRYNLNSTSRTLNKARDTVLTGRTFNSFSEDPATAARCFQLRRSLQRADSQYTIGQSVVSKYQVAWDTLNSVVDDVSNAVGDSALASILSGANDASGGARTTMGEQLTQLAESIVRTMNVKYGDNFVFAGADGLNTPLVFDAETNTLTYRNLNVSADGDQAALDYLANSEKKYADLGLGITEGENGEVVDTSAFNTALQSINFLGYGVDGEGDPKNIVCIINRMGQILKGCDEGGNFASGEEEAEFKRLFGKFEKASASLTNKHVELDARAAFLKSNQAQLENTTYSLQEQIIGMEDVDPADAITAYSWAQYCYNAALKVGNSILSESLMDYLRT